jgi:hypothetical protein
MIGGMLSAVKAQVMERVQDTVRRIVMYAVAGVVAAIGLGFLIAALYLGLRTFLEPWLAALVCGLLFAAGAGALMFLGSRKKDAKSKADKERERRLPPTYIEPLQQQIGTAVERNALWLAAGAFGVGLWQGLQLFRKRKRANGALQSDRVPPHWVRLYTSPPQTRHETRL